jgi:hypothetical protein
MIAPKSSLGENSIRYTEATEVLFSRGPIGRSIGGYVIGDRGSVDCHSFCILSLN